MYMLIAKYMHLLRTRVTVGQCTHTSSLNVFAIATHQSWMASSLWGLKGKTGRHFSSRWVHDLAPWESQLGAFGYVKRLTNWTSSQKMDNFPIKIDIFFSEKIRLLCYSFCWQKPGVQIVGMAAVGRCYIRSIECTGFLSSSSLLCWQEYCQRKKDTPTLSKERSEGQEDSG